MSEVMDVITICCKEGTPGIPGKKTFCEDCRTDIFIAFSTITHAMNQGNFVHLHCYCVDCALKNKEKLSQASPVDLSDQQKKEISKALSEHFK